MANKEKAKWTSEEIAAHIRLNTKDSYSSMVVISALYKKLYGVFPRIGMSGTQAEFAESIVKMLP